MRSSHMMFSTLCLFLIFENNQLICLSVYFVIVDWDMKLQQTMVEMFPLNSADAAYTKISAMLSTLGDPFTRIISPKV